MDSFEEMDCLVNDIKAVLSDFVSKFPQKKYGGRLCLYCFKLASLDGAFCGNCFSEISFLGMALPVAYWHRIKPMFFSKSMIRAVSESNDQSRKLRDMTLAENEVYLTPIECN